MLLDKYTCEYFFEYNTVRLKNYSITTVDMNVDLTYGNNNILGSKIDYVATF